MDSFIIAIWSLFFIARFEFCCYSTVVEINIVPIFLTNCIHSIVKYLVSQRKERYVNPISGEGVGEGWAFLLGFLK